MTLNHETRRPWGQNVVNRGDGRGIAMGEHDDHVILSDRFLQGNVEE